MAELAPQRPVEEGDHAPLVFLRLLGDAVGVLTLGLPYLLGLLRRAEVVRVAVAGVVLAAVDQEDRPGAIFGTSWVRLSGGSLFWKTEFERSRTA